MIFIGERSVEAQISRFQSFNVSMLNQRPGFKGSEFQGWNVL
jgi:hypothetical protein